MARKRNLYTEWDEIPPDVPDDELSPRDQLFRKLSQMDKSGELRALGGVSYGPEDAITPEKLGMGMYGAHHGAWLDLYDNWRKVLETLLASGEDFTAHWGAKKEIQWVTLARKGNKITVTGEVQIDNPMIDSTVTGKSPWYDAAWSAFGDLVPESIFDTIMTVMDADGSYDEFLADVPDFSTIFTASKTYPFTANLDKLLKYAEQLVGKADTGANKAYSTAEQMLVKQVVLLVKSDPTAFGFASAKHVDQIHRKWKKRR